MPDPIDPNDPDWVNKYLASMGGSTTTSTTTGKPATQTYAQGSAADKSATQRAAGWYPSPPANSMPLGPGSVTANGITWHQDPTTLNWAPGYATTKAEGALAINASRGQGAAPATASMPQANPGMSPEARPYAGLGQLSGTGGLANNQGVNIPGMEAFRNPGIGIPSDGRQTLTDRNGLNTIYGGHQGSMTQIPTAPGFRGEGQVGNSINFAGGGLPGGGGGSTSGGRLEPQNLFGPTTASVPGTYVQGQGNVGAANQMYSVPFNIGPGGAGLANIGGNNVQINSPLTNGGSMGYGYALNAMPSSSVFALTGRQPSEDPALQAMQALQLNAAIARGDNVMGVNPNQFGGFHAGTGNNPFSGNGGMGQGSIFGGFNPDPMGASTPPPAAPPAAYPGWYTNPATGGPAISPTNPGSLAAISNIWNGGGNVNGHPTGQSISPPSFAGSAGLAAPQASQAPVSLGVPNAGAPLTQAQASAMLAQAIADQRDRDQGGGGSTTDGPGFGPDGPQRFATGGNVGVMRPLGGASPHSMTTTEPLALVGMISGQMKGMVGEDGTGDGRPDAERLSFPNPGMMHVQPLHHMAHFAGGGNVQAQGPTPFSNEWYLDQIRNAESASKSQLPVNWGAVYSLPFQLAGSGAYAQQQAVAPQQHIDNGGVNVQTFATGGNVITDPATTGGGVDPATTTPGVNSNVPAGFDPQDNSILAPWQKAQQTLGYQQHLRDSIDNPRRQAGGLGASTGVPVYQGDTPQANMGPGVFYDQRPQVNDVISQITGNRSAINALGPGEDITPLVGQISDIGIQLDTQQRLRDLATSRVAADAQDQVSKQQAAGKLGYLQADLTAAQNALANAQQSAPYATDQSAAVQQIYDLTAKITGIQSDINSTTALINNPGANVQAIDAQITALQNSLPQGFNQAQAETQRTLLNQRVSNQTKREQLTQGQYNLSKLGVPNLSAPLAA